MYVYFRSARARNAHVEATLNHRFPAQVDLQPDPCALAKTFGGVFLEHVPLGDFVALAASLDEDEVKADRRAENVPGAFPGTSSRTTTLIADDDRSSRLYLALRRVIAAENLDAVALRCGPELPQGFGQWPHLAIARLADEGFPVACEGDVDGALTMLVCKLLGCDSAPYLAQWLEHDATAFVCWQAGACPSALCVDEGPGAPKIAKHARDGVPAVVDATIKPFMNVTVARLWVLDGTYHLAVADGKTLPPKRHLAGNNGLIQLDLADRGGKDLFAVFEHWVAGFGMPHQVVVSLGHHKDSLLKFARANKITVV